jgi:hypothetical protein
VIVAPKRRVGCVAAAEHHDDLATQIAMRCCRLTLNVCSNNAHPLPLPLPCTTWRA